LLMVGHHLRLRDHLHREDAARGAILDELHLQSWRHQGVIKGSSMGHQGVLKHISPCQRCPCPRSDARRGPRHAPVGKGGAVVSTCMHAHAQDPVLDEVLGTHLRGREEGAVVSTCMHGEHECSTRSSARHARHAPPLA
jgi:hypothetical protein